MASFVHSPEESGATTASSESCSSTTGGGCSNQDAPVTGPVTSRKQEHLMPEIKECEKAGDSCQQADQLAEDIRHSLSTSKQHIILARQAADGSSSIDSEPPDSPPRPRRHRISSRVHFPEDVHDPEIHVSRERDSGVDVNLGFLQVNHRYRCCFTVINSVAGNVHARKAQGILIRKLSAFPKQDGEGHDVELEIISHKDGVLSEEFDLVSETKADKKCKVVLHSRFLGRDQGTPLLKEGIHCLATEMAEDESEEGSDCVGCD